MIQWFAVLRLDREKLWSRIFGEAMHFWLFVFCVGCWVENVYRLGELHELVYFGLGRVVFVVKTAVGDALYMSRTIGRRFVGPLLRLHFTPFANQVKCYPRFLVISESVPAKLAFENCSFVEALFGETYQRAPGVFGHLVEILVILILTRACTVVELGDARWVVVVKYGRDAWSLGVPFGSPGYVGLSHQDRIIARVINHIEIRPTWGFCIIFRPVFHRRLASTIILVFCAAFLEIARFILQEWNFGFSRPEILRASLRIVALPRAFGPWLTTLRKLAGGPHRASVHLPRTLASDHMVLLNLRESSFGLGLANCSLTCFLAVTWNHSSFGHFWPRENSFWSVGRLLRLAGNEFWVALKQITGEARVFISFVWDLTANSNAGFRTNIIILVVRIFRIMRPTRLINMPHLNLLFFDLSLLRRLFVITNWCNSRILESLADDLIWQVLYIWEALAILGLILTRYEAASHWVAIHFVTVVI